MAKADETKLHKFLLKLQADGTVKVSATQKSLFTQAVQQDLAETAADPKPPKKPPKNPPTFARITPAGLRWLLERRSAGDALRELEQSIASRLDAVRTLSEQLVASLAVAEEASRRAVSDIRSAIATAAAPPTASAPATPEAEAVGFVEQWWRDRGHSCSVVDLKAHLDSLGPTLSIGAFHDLLRSLHRGGKVSLSNWGRTLSEMPQPELAMFLADKVMYYVNPRDRSR